MLFDVCIKLSSAFIKAFRQALQAVFPSEHQFQLVRKVTTDLCSVTCHILKAISTSLVSWISEFAVAEITASVAM